LVDGYPAEEKQDLHKVIEDFKGTAANARGRTLGKKLDLPREDVMTTAADFNKRAMGKRIRNGREIGMSRKAQEAQKVGQKFGAGLFIWGPWAWLLVPDEVRPSGVRRGRSFDSMNR